MSSLAYKQEIEKRSLALFAKYHTIVTIDPGGTTGVCVVTNIKYAIPLEFVTSLVSLKSDNYNWLQFIDKLDTLDSFLQGDDRTVLVITENYRERLRTAIATSGKENLPERILGAMTYISYKNKFDVMSVEPSTHKGNRSDLKLESILDYFGLKINTEHEKDAVSLLLYGLGNENKIKKAFMLPE